MNISYNQISLLPWLDLNDIQIGNALFWKYDPSVVTNEEIKAYLDKYVKCYVDKHQKLIKAVTIVSYKDKNYFEPLSSEEYQHLNFARNILCFLCISEQSRIALTNNNNSMGPASADIFEMVSQNFVPGTEDIAVESGSMKSGGWTLDEIHFQEPWSTGGFFKNINGNLLAAINKLLQNKGHEDLKNRLLRSIEWFRLAHIENGSISLLFRAVMMATAFEIIFDIPNVGDKAGFLSDKIDQSIAREGFIQKTRKYGKKNENKTRSVAAWWGWDFYKLRNAIVHGDNVPMSNLIYTDWITQAIVADVVFYSYIVFLLSEAGHFDSEFNKPKFEDIYKLFKWTS